MRSAVHIAAVCMLPLLGWQQAYAQLPLPDNNDRDRWQTLLGDFAECSAIYNLTALHKDVSGGKVSYSYRELANQALVSGNYSASKLQLEESYVQSIYSVKMEQWQAIAKVKESLPQLFAKADSCMQTTLAEQDAILATLRKESSQQ